MVPSILPIPVNRICSLVQTIEYGNGAGCHSDDSVTWHVLPKPSLADVMASRCLIGLSCCLQEEKRGSHGVVACKPAAGRQRRHVSVSCGVTGSFCSKYIQRMRDTTRKQTQVPALHAHFTCIRPVLSLAFHNQSYKDFKISDMTYHIPHSPSLNF